jgi:hypothetical protein
MASELSMNGRKKIETLQKEFTQKFPYLTLVFLDKEKRAIDISKSLSEVRQAKGADISIIASLKVNTLEKRFLENFGLVVEVATASSATLTNATAIGNGAVVSASNTIQLGNSIVTDVKTSGTMTASSHISTSDKRLKRNIAPLQNSIAAIMQLKPVSYEKKSSLSSTNYSIKENGFIAQELQKVMPSLVIEGTDKDKLLSVNYTATLTQTFNNLSST